MGIPMTYISGNTGAYQSGTFKKGTIALNLNPSSLASGNNWYNGVDVTSEQYLIYSDTYSQGQATLSNSKPTAWTTPDLSDTSLLNLINTLPDRVGLLPFTSLPLALQWLNGTNKYFLIKTNFENIVTSGLVLNLDAGWYNSYSGGTTWFDRSGSGNHVTLRNGPTFDSSSQGSILFDGSDDYAGNDSPTLPTGNVTATICVWINIPTIGSSWQGIAGWGNRSSRQSALLDMNNGRLAFSTWGGVGGEDLISTYNVPLRTWKFVVGSINNKNIKLYADGVKVLDASITSTPNVASTALRVATTDYPGRLLNTKVATVQIYNRELSDIEILQNYNATKSRFGVYDIVQSGLTHSYDAANYLSYPRSGTTWFDMTSTANNGTLINGPTFNTGATPSIQFDGSNDYINATNTKFIGSAPSTFEFWINPSTVTNAGVEQSFLQVGNASSNQMRLYFFRTGKFAVAYYSNDFTFNYTAVANTIYHAVFTENGFGDVQLYINGVLVSSGNLTPPNTQGSTYWIGQYSGSYKFNGKMFSHRAYGRVLSSQEVVQNYEAQRTIYGATGYTTSGLTLNLDAGNYASYPTTGTKWVDISGNYNNGTLINGPTWSSVSGGTFTFDGADDWVTMLAGSDFTYGTGNFTVECWFYDTSSISVPYSVLYSQTTGGSNYFLLGVASNQVSWVGTLSGGGTGILASGTYSRNTWNHAVVSRISGVVTVYLNGVGGTPTSNTTNFTNTTYVPTIGDESHHGGNNSWKGYIPILRIYKGTGLTASEVLQNYNALKGRFGL